MAENHVAPCSCRTLTPPRDVIVLPPIDHRYVPIFAYREVLCFDAADGEYAARLRLTGGNMNQCLGHPNGTGEQVPGIIICPFVHSAESMVPSARYFASHPEYSGLVYGMRHGAPIGGQLCYTNPEVLKLCTEWVLERDLPQLRVVSHGIRVHPVGVVENVLKTLRPNTPVIRWNHRN